MFYRRYQVGGKRFLTKESIKAYVRNMISKYEAGDILNKKDTDFVRDLLSHHQGIKNEGPIDVGINERTNNKHFRVSRRPFSWNICVGLIGLSREKKLAKILKEAGRNTIRPQIQDYLETVAIDVFLEPRYMCEITMDLYERPDVHVDHHFDIIQYKDIIQQYMEANKDIEVEDSLMKEPHYTRFNDFHKQKAILRIIKKEINIRGKSL